MDAIKSNIAVLIDGDNAQAKLVQEILDEVSKYGKATIRRIYGDWTSPHLNSWKSLINEHSFSPVQKFSYTTGKNSTDSSLIIDAMDILHSHKIDGFCIVSSDSDFTGLAKRIREEGLFVMGIGEKKTPNAFVQSCEIFTYTETISKANITESVSDNKTKAKKSAPPSNQMNLKTIDKAFNISINEEEEVSIAKVGLNIRKIDPSFDTRTYGFKNLTSLFASLSKYDVIKNVVNGLNQPLVKLK